MGVSEFGSSDALLLLLNPSATFQSELGGPLDGVVGDIGFRIWEHQFEQSTHRFMRGGCITSAQGSTELDTTLEPVDPALGAQMIPA
jgi:hypothetical protein